jgi:prevent-host-death family protein
LDFETTYDHKRIMKHARVSELKAHLSAYLEYVRKGETVVVSDRQTPIARLVPVDQRTDGVTIEPARRPASEVRHVRGVRLLRRVDVGKVLRESREPH